MVSPTVLLRVICWKSANFTLRVTVRARMPTAWQCPHTLAMMGSRAGVLMPPSKEAAKGGAIGNALPLMQGIAPSQPQSVSLNGFSMKRQVESLDLHLAFHSQTETAVDDFKDEQ